MDLSPLPTSMDGIPKSQPSAHTVLTDVQKQAARDRILQTAKFLLGVPYEFGAEWTDYTKPPQALDCSELVEGLHLIAGLWVPDGAQAQFDFTLPTDSPQSGDLAFFAKGRDPKQVYHVGIIYDAVNIVEARAFEQGRDWTGKVTLRERKYWEAWKNFAGYRAHPMMV